MRGERRLLPDRGKRTESDQSSLLLLECLQFAAREMRLNVGRGRCSHPPFRVILTHNTSLNMDVKAITELDSPDSLPLEPSTALVSTTLFFHTQLNPCKHRSVHSRNLPSTSRSTPDTPNSYIFARPPSSAQHPGTTLDTNVRNSEHCS